MVVVSSRLMTSEEYFQTPESNRHEELEFGLLVREGAVTGWHQGQVGWIFVKLFEHVRMSGRGHVRCAPSDVVLDHEKALIVQPDILVLLGERVKLMDDKVWGAPDLVIEVASPSTRRRDRTHKVPWYRSYGVRECWLVDDEPEEITVYYLDSEPEAPRRLFKGDEILESRVLPDFRHPTSSLFDPSCHEMRRRGAQRPQRMLRDR